MRRGARAVTFMLLVAWMIASPAQWHIGVRVFGQKHAWWSKGWTMMRGTGRDICALRFYEVQEDGTEVTIDRAARLRIAPRTFRGRRARVFHGELPGHIRRICLHTPPDVDLRLEARCASYQGWETTNRGKRNICKARGLPQRGRR